MGSQWNDLVLTVERSEWHCLCQSAARGNTVAATPVHTMRRLSEDNGMDGVIIVLSVYARGRGSRIFFYGGVPPRFCKTYPGLRKMVPQNRPWSTEIGLKVDPGLRNLDQK